MPERARRTAAFFGASLVACSLLFIWFVGLRASVASRATAKETAVEAAHGDEFSPIASIKRGFGELTKGFGKELYQSAQLLQGGE